MSSNSVVSDVLSALHSIAHTKRNTPHRQDSTAGSSFLRRRDSTISVASSVKSTTSIASIKSIARSLFRHKQEDMEPVTKGKGKGKGKGKKRGSVHNPVNAEQAAIAARAAENNKFYQSQSPITVVLRDPVVLEKLLEGILDSTAGKRMVSRLARTCKAFSEPALNVLWRDLYSFIPLIGMFPSPLLRRPKKPGLGLTKVPEQADWEKVTLYGDKVRRITYEESANNVSTTVFPIFEEYRPRTYLLPGLRHLTWRAETPVGLDRCLMFLNPELQTLNLEIGTRFPQLSSFLKDVSDRTHLTSFSFASPTPLPDDFTELLAPQTDLRRVNLVAPGALSPGAGRWLGALPHLRSLQLDLTGRSVIAVEGFFDMMRPRSGDSTPDSIGSIDSGVFSADELDFSEIRKSALRLTGDLHSKGAFAKLRQLQLTGEVSNMAVFLKHLSSRLAHLELAIEDPPDRADWQDLCAVLCEHFGRSLHSLKITATGGSKFADLVRSTTKLASGGTHLTLEFLSALPALRRLEIDLPESTIFHAADLSHLAAVCPGLEELRLCPTAIFPSQTGAPKITLEDIAPLLRACKNLHTLSVVVNAQGGSQQVLHQRDVSSASLQRLHVGHSWIQDPLQVAILLSHFASRCDTLRWFHERNRPGYVEANDLGWQKVAEALPFLQDVREMERQAVVVSVVTQEPEKPETDEKGVDATVSTRNQGVSVRPITFELSVQASPTLVEACVEAIVEQVSTSVDATTPTSEASVDAVVETSESSVDAVVSTVEIAIDAVPEVEVLPEVDSAPEVKPATIPEDVANVGVVPSPTSPTSPTSVSNHIDPSAFTLSKVVEALFSSSSHNDTAASDPQPTPSEKNYARPSSYDLFFYATSALIYYPLFIPLKILDMSMSALHRKGRTSNEEEMSEKQLTSDPAPNYDDTPMDSMPGVMTPPQVVEIHEPLTYNASKSEKVNEQPPAAEVERKSSMSGEVLVGKWIRQGLPLNQTSAKITATRVGLSRSLKVPQYIMSDNRKQEKDFSPEVDALLPEAEKLVKAGKLQEGLDKLFVLEKQTRNAADLASTSRLVSAIVQHCYSARDYALLNSSISILAKKHGQLKGAVQTMTEKVMQWLDEIKTREGVDKWLELLETLRGVTEGKIYLETPRARVTLLLSHHHEVLSNDPKATPENAKKSLRTAAELLSELQVETYSSMERREKTEFILEQMRLLVAVARQKDAEAGQEGKDSLSGGDPEWTKVRVGGRKINEEFLKEEENEDLKLKFYDLMIQHALHQSSYLDVAKYYQKVWETPSIKEDVTDKGRIALEHITYYVVLAPHNNEQAGMLHGLYIDPALKPLELHYNLVKSFHTHELMRWPGIELLYGSFLRQTPVFSQEKRWEDLHTRVIEHNIRIIAEYYSRITIPRLMSLLDLTAQQTEETLSRLVVSGTIWARIDRPAGIINFRAKRTAEDVMNDWSSDMQRLLGLVEKTWMGMNAAQAAQSRVVKS